MFTPQEKEQMLKILHQEEAKIKNSVQLQDNKQKSLEQLDLVCRSSLEHQAD